MRFLNCRISLLRNGFMGCHLKIRLNSLYSNITYLKYIYGFNQKLNVE